jgi:hypothetical protein
VLALAHYHLGEYEEAARCAEHALRRRAGRFVLRTLIASLGQLGRTDEATALRPELQGLKVEDERYWEVISPYADPAHRAHLQEGLRKAGPTD